MQSKKRLITSISLALCLAVGASVYGTWQATQVEDQYRRLHQTLVKLNAAITADKLDEASQLLSQAKSIVPNSRGINLSGAKLETVQASKTAFDRGERQLHDQNLTAAVDSYRQVSTIDSNRHAKALVRIAGITSSLEQVARKKIDGLIGKKNYKDALAEITDFERTFPDSLAFTETRTQLNTLIAAQEAAARKAALAAMRVQHDKFQGETWYTDRTSPYYRDSNGFYLYFGVSDGSADSLRLVLQYYASDWLFVSSAQVYVDGETYDVGPTDYFSWNRDNNSMIWEWADEVASDTDLEAIRAIIKSKTAIIRFEGDQYHDDRTITATQKAALARVLTAYKALGGY